MLEIHISAKLDICVDPLGAYHGSQYASVTLQHPSENAEDAPQMPPWVLRDPPNLPRYIPGICPALPRASTKSPSVL